MIKNLMLQSLAISPAAHEIINSLPKQGILRIKNDGYTYLDIDDNYIHFLYPFIDHESTKKPEYFELTTHFIGAHISIIYPDEKALITPTIEEHKMILFTIDGLFSADLLATRYFFLKVSAIDLTKIRLNCGLSPQLQFKGLQIGFHITIATQLLTEL